MTRRFPSLAFEASLPTFPSSALAKRACLALVVRRYGMSCLATNYGIFFAVDLLQRDTSLADVSSLLGHKNLKISQKHYSAFTSGRWEALEQAVRQT